MNDVDQARKLAEAYLASELPQRWVHVQAVARRADEVASVLPVDRDVLVSAAWLHDIGYAAARTGLHSLDGAVFLRELGWPDRVVGLVAYHSGAAAEALLRGLADALSAVAVAEESLTADALWYADMTTSPDGRAVPLASRLAEIAQRYGPDDVVTRSLELSRPELEAAVRRVEARLRSVA